LGFAEVSSIPQKDKMWWRTLRPPVKTRKNHPVELGHGATLNSKTADPHRSDVGSRDVWVMSKDSGSGYWVQGYSTARNLVGQQFYGSLLISVVQWWHTQRIGRRLILLMHVRTSVGTWTLIGNLRVS
jgi:hypothetical protein